MSTRATPSSTDSFDQLHTAILSHILTRDTDATTRSSLAVLLTQATTTTRLQLLCEFATSLSLPPIQLGFGVVMVEPAHFVRLTYRSALDHLYTQSPDDAARTKLFAFVVGLRAYHFDAMGQDESTLASAKQGGA